MHTLRTGRRGSGFGQRQVLDEDHAIASEAFGENFVDAHLDAMQESRTKVSLQQLAETAERKTKKMQ